MVTWDSARARTHLRCSTCGREIDRLKLRTHLAGVHGLMLRTAPGWETKVTQGQFDSLVHEAESFKDQLRERARE